MAKQKLLNVVHGHYNRTFSGTDMVVSMVFPGCSPVTIGDLTTVSYSIYRDTHPVRTCGFINTRGFTKGPRTIAGTMIFTVFEKHVVNRVREQLNFLSKKIKIRADELPPFHLFITMANEYGYSARINIFGITVVDEGQVMSVEDLFTENQWSYMARDIQIMDSIRAEQNLPLMNFYNGEPTGAFTMNDLVMDNVYEKLQKELDNMKEANKAAIEKARAEAMKKYTENALGAGIANFKPTPTFDDYENKSSNTGKHDNKWVDKNKDKSQSIKDEEIVDLNFGKTKFANPNKDALLAIKTGCVKTIFGKVVSTGIVADVPVKVQLFKGSRPSSNISAFTDKEGILYITISNYHTLREKENLSIKIFSAKKVNSKANMLKYKLRDDSRSCVTLTTIPKGDSYHIGIDYILDY